MGKPNFATVKRYKTKMLSESEIVAALRVKLLGPVHGKWRDAFGDRGPKMRSRIKHILEHFARHTELRSDAQVLEYYLWLTGEEDGGVADGQDSVVKDCLTTESERNASELLLNDKYVYNPESDTYITFLKISPKPVTMPGGKHRAMKRAYSNWDGQPSTINEICRSFGIPRPWFQEYRQAHGWTHDSEPFTDEEILDRDEDEMIEEALQAKRQSLFQKFEKQKWQETKRDAERFRHFEQYVLGPLTELGEKRSRAQKITRLNLRVSRSRFIAVLGAVDVHFGKVAWRSESLDAYGRDEARKRLFSVTETLLERITTHGAPEYIVVPGGNDWLHTDNAQGTTTKGTQQDLDGVPAQMLDEGFDMAASYIETLLQVAPVYYIHVPANHDNMLGAALAKFLAGYFRNEKDVTIDVDYFERKYRVYGATLMALTHHAKKNIQYLIASEAAQLWGQTRNHVCFAAHLHHQELMQSDAGGVLLYIMPSISGDDRWHSAKGYTMARKAMGAYLIDEGEGVIADFYAPC